MKTISKYEFEKWYDSHCAEDRHKEPLEFSGYRIQFKDGSVYEHKMKLKDNASMNWHGFYDSDQFIYESFLNGALIVN